MVSVFIFCIDSLLYFVKVASNNSDFKINVYFGANRALYFEAWNDTSGVSKKAEQQTKRDIYEELRVVSTFFGVKREMKICLFGELLILRERANI